MAILKRISFVFLVLFPVFEAVCYGHLYWKRNDILIRKRNKCAIYIASSAGWLAYLNLIISILGGVPCGVFYVVSLAIAPVAVGPQIVQALTLRGTIKYSQLVTEEEISSRAQKRQLSMIPSSGDSAMNEEPSASPHQMTKIMEANLVMERTRKVVMITKFALLIIPSAFLVLALALSSDASQLGSKDFDQCQPEPTYFRYASSAFGVASTALALMVTILVKDIDDEIGLRREIQRNAIFLGFSYIIIIVVRFGGHFDWEPLLLTIQQMMLSFSMSIMSFIPVSGLDNIESWAETQKKRINPAAKNAVPGYAQSIPKGRGSTISSRGSIRNVLGRQTSITSILQKDKLEQEVNVSWNAGLCILLSTENGIILFSQHCAREFSAENVLFWCAVNDYKAKLDEENCILPSTEATDNQSSPTNPPSKQDKNTDTNALAKEINNSFIDHPSKTQVNLSSKMRSDIQNAIDSGQCKRETFDEAQREIFAVMSRDSYPRFLASKKSRMTVV